MEKWVLLLNDQGAASRADPDAFCHAFTARFGDGVTARRAIFNAMGPASVGSRTGFDEPPVKFILEAWLKSGASTSELERWLSDEGAHLLSPVGAFRARENVVIAPSGRAAIKRMTLIGRLPGLDLQRFEHHWKDVHGAMASELPHVRGYVQTVLETTEATTAVDAIATMWFDDANAIGDAFGSDVGQRLVADTPRFCGSAASFEVKERLLFDTGAQHPST